jgi:hypothetical protein
MGLLDDAIREHLDLKRRRGADPAEVERAEREALGPVRRQPEGADELARSDESPAQEAVAYDYEEERGWDEPLLPGPAALEPEPVDHERVRERWPENPPEEHRWAPAAEDPPEERPRTPAPEDPPITAGHVEPPPPAPHRADPLGPETAEYQVEFEDEPEEESASILEETPDFLQEAPEHDRLWFEQRPPKDFDFDG